MNIMESLRKEVAAGIEASTSIDALENVIERVLSARDDLNRIQQKALSRRDSLSSKISEPDVLISCLLS